MGKKKFWAPGADYHHLLAAADNTLQGLLPRRTAALVAPRRGVDVAALLGDYVALMTTPDGHNDTYCGTCHRMFFANRAGGVPLAGCPGNDGHNVDTADALVATTPIALWDAEPDVAAEHVRRMARMTRNAPVAADHAAAFARLLRAVAAGGGLRTEVQATGAALGMDVAASVRRSPADPATACYVSEAFRAVLHVAYKYGEVKGGEAKGDAFKRAVLANANRGGDNVGTGALLGALLGSWVGGDALPADLVTGLGSC